MTGRHVVVTGGRGALGEGVVAVLRARGATVHVPPREVRLDDEAAAVAYYAALPAVWASVQLVGGFATSPLTETSVAEFEHQHRLNAVTCFLACREAARAIRRTGGGGRIVNVASRAALHPTANQVAYTASKASVVGLTQVLAVELAGDGILVNAVVPSTIDTPANRAAMPKADPSKWAKPAEIGQTIAFLVSPENTRTTGALVPV